MGCCKRTDQCNTPSHCGACCGGSCGGQSLVLTEEEFALLRQLATLAFLPVARDGAGRPVCYEEDCAPEEMTTAIEGLLEQGLIRVDYDIPLVNFNYEAYRAHPDHGSMALTAAGQRAADAPEIKSAEG